MKLLTVVLTVKGKKKKKKRNKFRRTAAVSTNSYLMTV